MFDWVSREDLHGNCLAIGRPLSGYTSSIVDRFLQPILFGHQTGEVLIIGGDFHRPDLSREVFGKKEKIFCRTGD